jgi:hypothetical protein
MKNNLFTNKSLIRIATITIIGICILLCLTGCAGNYQFVDLNYTYDKAICNIGNETKEIEIDKWNDCEGEQLQIIDEDGNVYLVSSFNCTLFKRK